MKHQTWPTVALGSRVKFLSGGTPSKSEDRYWNGDIPWIGSGEMSEPRIYKTSHSVTYDGARNGTRLVPRNTVLIVVRGMSLAKECRVSLTTRESTFNQDVKSLSLSSGIDPKFAFYYLRSQRFHLRDAASEAAHGTKKLDMPVLEQWPFPDVPHSTQRKIAAILTAYDDLIEVNKRRIALLEKMAEELYREWFVRLRFPGYQDTRFVKGVPEGWEFRPLIDLGTFLNGYAFKPSHWGTEGVPIIKIKEMGSGITAETPRNSGDDIPSKYHFDDGEIIFSWSGTLLVRSWDEGPGLLNQHLFKVEPKQGIPHSFLFHALAFSIPLFEVLTTGATMQHIKRKELSFVKVMVPPSSLLKQFDDIVGPIVDSKLKLKKVNRNLTKTRDLLLPRLISGKLSVEDLDIQFPPSMQEGTAEQESLPEARHARIHSR